MKPTTTRRKRTRKAPDILAARMAATAIELECEIRRLVALALGDVADTVRPAVLGTPFSATKLETLDVPESVRRLARDRTLPIFALFPGHSAELLACLDDLARFFAERCHPHTESKRGA